MEPSLGKLRFLTSTFLHVLTLWRNFLLRLWIHHRTVLPTFILSSLHFVDIKMTTERIEVPVEAGDDAAITRAQHSQQTASFTGQGILSLIPEFYGDEGVSALIFEKAVRQAKALAAWSDEQTRSIVNLKMRGPALLYTAHDPTYARVKKLDEALELLKKRFDPQHLAGTSLQRLMNTAQRPGETVQAYAARIRHLVSQATPLPKDASTVSPETVQTFEGIGKHFFLMGLVPQLRDKVVSAGPASLSDAIERANSEELNAIHFRRGPVVQDDLSSRFMALDVRSMSTTPRQNQARSQGGAQQKSFRCYSCGKPGHYSRVCRDRQKVKPTAGNGNPRGPNRGPRNPKQGNGRPRT